MARLSYVDSKGVTQTAHIGREHPEVVIGRAKSATFRIREKAISSSHCKIVYADDGFSVEDLGSTNGTFYQGERTDGFALSLNDEFTCGNIVIRLGADALDLGIKPVGGSVEAEESLKGDFEAKNLEAFLGDQ